MKSFVSLKPLTLSKSCFCDCLVFLLSDEFIIKGRERDEVLVCAYTVKDEEWI